jgi:hypothetical protein
MSQDLSVREELATSPRTAPPTLAKLSFDTEYRVRIGVARNPATPAEGLERLASGDSEDWGTGAARENPSCPPRPWWKRLLGG